MWIEANENLNLKMNIPEWEYPFTETKDAVDDAIAQKNNELLELDPNEYLIWLLNDLEKWQELTDDEQNIAKTIIAESFPWKDFSMKELFEMDVNKKAELLWKLTVIIKYVPTNPKDIPYTSVTDWLRNGEKFGKLQMKLWSWTSKTATINDLKDYFGKAQAFQIQNMLKLYRKTFPFWSKNIPTMYYAPLTWDINWNDSISKDFSNVWREYYSYNLSELDNDKVNL